MISVIIPSYRNPKYLDLCLKSLIDGQKNHNEIIAVIDGFEEENKEVISKYPSVWFMTFGENRGFQSAINYGVWNASGEKMFVVNDDNVFPPEWDVRIEEQYDPNAVITVNQIEPTGPGMFNFPVVDCGKTVETFDMERFIAADKQLSKPVSTPDGNIFPFLVNKKWFMAVGGFDTFYNSPNLCDWDFFLKLELLPHVTQKRIHHAHVYHFGSVSTKKNAESESFRQREKYAMDQYQYKWKFGPYNGPNNTKLPQNISWTK